MPRDDISQARPDLLKPVPHPLLARLACAVTAVAVGACARGTALPTRNPTPRVEDAATELRTEPATADRCSDSAVAVQVLGSGGPIADDDRASAAYLLWLDGRARALVDAGGGVFQRFGATQARMEDLDVVALTHLHVDHAGGLMSLLKSGYFIERSRPLPVLGPEGNEGFPAVDAFLEHQLAANDGSYRYLSGYLQQDGKLFSLQPRVLPQPEDAGSAFENQRLRIDARRVKHGQVPALGFLVSVGDVRIAFTGDQSAQGREDFARMIAGADLLIAHHAISEGAQNLTHLHAMPSELGALAAQADAGRMVLSHNIQRALADLDRGMQAIREHYDGPVEVATDLACFVVRE